MDGAGKPGQLLFPGPATIQDKAGLHMDCGLWGQSFWWILGGACADSLNILLWHVHALWVKASQAGKTASGDVLGVQRGVFMYMSRFDRKSAE